MDKVEQKALDDIEQFGCHVIHVLEEGGQPPFAYSVGIQRVSEQPEVVIVGLNQDIAHFVVNEYNRRVREGEVFTPGERYGGFLGGFDVEFRAVERSHYQSYLGWGLWLYRGDDFETLQIVYPTTDGVWPWDDAASDSFLSWQPLLTSPSGETNAPLQTDRATRGD